MQKEQIDSFLMVEQLKNISSAAGKLFISQSTLSHRIQLLEEELGVTLFARKQGSKIVSLTPEGERFMPLASQYLEIYPLKNTAMIKLVSIIYYGFLTNEFEAGEGEKTVA